MDTTSAVGGYADGVLGCTTDAGLIRLIQGWNFYAGNDASQIGTGQYDFVCCWRAANSWAVWGCRPLGRDSHAASKPCNARVSTW
jgi:hypothetical protein